MSKVLGIGPETTVSDVLKELGVKRQSGKR
jgi:hypothetical protein